MCIFLATFNSVACLAVLRSFYYSTLTQAYRVYHSRFQGIAPAMADSILVHVLGQTVFFLLLTVIVSAELHVHDMLIVENCIT